MVMQDLKDYLELMEPLDLEDQMAPKDQQE